MGQVFAAKTFATIRSLIVTLRDSAVTASMKTTSHTRKKTIVIAGPGCMLSKHKDVED